MEIPLVRKKNHGPLRKMEAIASFDVISSPNILKGRSSARLITIHGTVVGQRPAKSGVNKAGFDKSCISKRDLEAPVCSSIHGLENPAGACGPASILICEGDRCDDIAFRRRGAPPAFPSIRSTHNGKRMGGGIAVQCIRGDPSFRMTYKIDVRICDSDSFPVVK